MERHGVPLGWAIDGANRNDVKLLAPTIDSIQDAGFLADVDTMHLDRGYDYPKIRRELNAAGLEDLVIQRRRRPGDADRPMPMRLGLRWIVEATNSWLSNYCQLLRNTDRRLQHRHDAERNWVSAPDAAAALVALALALGPPPAFDCYNVCPPLRFGVERWDRATPGSSPPGRPRGGRRSGRRLHLLRRRSASTPRARAGSTRIQHELGERWWTDTDTSLDRYLAWSQHHPGWLDSGSGRL